MTTYFIINNKKKKIRDPIFHNSTRIKVKINVILYNEDKCLKYDFKYIT